MSYFSKHASARTLLRLRFLVGNHFSRRVFSVLIIFACSPFFGCSARLAKGYTGPNRSDNELAIIRPQGVTIHAVNGIELNVFHSGALILPGTNRIDLTVDESNFNSNDRDAHLYHITFEALAGLTYAITGQRGDGRLCAFPIEPKSGSPDFKNPAGCLTR